MTLNLLTGKAGTPHVTSGDMGAVQAGLVGNGSYLLQNADGAFPSVTMQSANKALVPILNLVIEGRYARVTEAETVAIESGVTGVNRNDLVCVKYTRDASNIESTTLAVLKGTASSGTATDPTVPDGSILDEASTVWIPIARIPISGINAGTPVMLIRQLPPISQLWDSVTHPEPGVEYHVGTWYDGTPLYRQVFRITNVKNGSRTQYGLPSGARLRRGLTYPQSYNVSNSYWHRTYSFEDGTLLADFGSSNTAAEAVVYVDAWYVYV